METQIVASAFTISTEGGTETYSATRESIIVITPDGMFNVSPQGQGPTAPNTGCTIEVDYRFTNTGPRAEFCFKCQTVSDEPGIPPGDIISTPWDIVESGRTHFHAHWLRFGKFGAHVKTWIYARPPGGGAEQLVIPEFVFYVGTHPPTDGGTKQYQRTYKWSKEVWFYGSAQTDLNLDWAGTLNSALLEVDIDTFIIGTSYKIHLNDQIVIEGTQYDAEHQSKDVTNIVRKGLNKLLAEVSWLSVTHWTLNATLTLTYTCTPEENEGLKPVCQQGYHWDDKLKTCVPDTADWSWLIWIGAAIAGLYALGRGLRTEKRGRKK